MFLGDGSVGTKGVRNQAINTLPAAKCKVWTIQLWGVKNKYLCLRSSKFGFGSFSLFCLIFLWPEGCSNTNCSFSFFFGGVKSALNRELIWPCASVFSPVKPVEQHQWALKALPSFSHPSKHHPLSMSGWASMIPPIILSLNRGVWLRPRQHFAIGLPCHS